MSFSFLSFAYISMQFICRAMNINGLIGYIGGYIGLFVGYSILQIPNTLFALTRKCKKYYFKIKKEKGSVPSIGIHVNVKEGKLNDAHKSQISYSDQDTRIALQELQAKLYRLTEVVNEQM